MSHGVRSNTMDQMFIHTKKTAISCPSEGPTGSYRICHCTQTKTKSRVEVAPVRVISAYGSPLKISDGTDP